MNPPHPSISVVIPAYNAREVIGRAVESVLAQTRRPDEVIVVDDGSTDGTREAVQRFGDRVRYLFQANAGASAARNTGIEHARGEWIAFLDGDDEWLEDHLRLSMELTARHPDLRWVTGNFYRCPCEPKPARAADLAGGRLKRAQELAADGEVFDSYFAAHQCGAMGWTGTMVIRKDLLQEAGLFLEGQKRINDVDLWLRMAYRGERMGYVFEPTAIYHMGVPGSILKVHRDGGHIERFLDRHLELAAQANMLEAFKPCAAAMLGYWVQNQLEHMQAAQARKLLVKYGYLLTLYCRSTTYIRTLFPKTSLRYEHWKKARKGSLL